ncbi:MAG: hypothetical protein NTV22_14825, partial [bacterium]|nr:hypothetical protein [bacterium]
KNDCGFSFAPLLLVNFFCFLSILPQNKLWGSGRTHAGRRGHFCRYSVYGNRYAVQNQQKKRGASLRRA